ncbi:hypothetical protein LguiB_017535 [Lonicera macranthoides]
MGAEKNLKDMGIDYMRQRVEEGGICVDQLFFHYPDGFKIEICNCDNLPVIPLAREMWAGAVPQWIVAVGKGSEWARACDRELEKLRRSEGRRMNGCTLDSERERIEKRGKIVVFIYGCVLRLN